MKRLPILEGGIVLATALSLGMLGLLLAAPLFPQPDGEASPIATAPPTATPEPILPPLGLFLSRTPLSFGPCFAIELEPRSYPLGAGGPTGIASVVWWQRGMTGCDSRSSELGGVEAVVTPIPTDDAPDGPTGFSLAFRLPLPPDGTEITVEVAILPLTESDPSLLQALEVSSPGAAGLVLDRVGEVNPPLDPLPSGS
jgi:hypothetical protein